MTDLEEVFLNASPRGPEDAVGFCIWRITLAYQRRVETELRPLDLTHLQYVVLALSAWLNHTQGATRQRDIAAISGVQEAQVSHMVKALKVKRLLRQSAGADPRVRVVTLTASGIKALRTAMPKMLALQEEFWPAGAETDHLLRLLNTTRQNLLVGGISSHSQAAAK